MAGKTLWINDTCPCRIILNNNQGTMEFHEWVQKCFVHKDVSDGELLNTLLTHNHQYDAQPEEDQPALKQAESIRIKKSGQVLKNVNYRARGRE